MRNLTPISKIKKVTFRFRGYRRSIGDMYLRRGLGIEIQYNEIEKIIIKVLIEGFLNEDKTEIQQALPQILVKRSEAFFKKSNDMRRK